MTCQQCAAPAQVFALKDGRIIYACNRHKLTVKHDLTVDWMRIGKWKRVR